LIAPSCKELNDAIVAALLQLEKVMVAGNYANRSVIAYARFVRIRHYGILGNYKRKERLKAILALFKVPKHPEKINVPTSIANLCRFGSSQVICPKCKKGKLVLTQITLPRSRDGPSKAIEKQGFGVLN
jgi:hypothetical protein